MTLPGDSHVLGRTDATQWRPYLATLGQHVVLSHPQRSAAFTVVNIWSGERPFAARRVFTSLAWPTK